MEKLDSVKLKDRYVEHDPIPGGITNGITNGITCSESIIPDTVTENDICPLHKEHYVHNKETSRIYCPGHERYIKTLIFAKYNELFCEIINKSLARFPLEFAFEGAFYRAWHISKKCYLGQTVEPECCEIDDITGDVVVYPGCYIHEYLKIANFDPDADDIYKFMKKNHFKVTGAKLTRRDAPMLIK